MILDDTINFGTVSAEGLTQGEFTKVVKFPAEVRANNKPLYLYLKGENLNANEIIAFTLEGNSGVSFRVDTELLDKGVYVTVRNMASESSGKLIWGNALSTGAHGADAKITAALTEGLQDSY